MRKTGEILEEYMSNKMSQRDLAAIIDVTPQYINNIVKGIKEMDVDMYSFAAKYTLLNWKELSSSNKKCDL